MQNGVHCVWHNPHRICYYQLEMIIYEHDKKARASNRLCLPRTTQIGVKETQQNRGTRTRPEVSSLWPASFANNARRKFYSDVAESMKNSRRTCFWAFLAGPFSLTCERIYFEILSEAEFAVPNVAVLRFVPKYKKELCRGPDGAYLPLVTILQQPSPKIVNATSY